MSIKRVVYSKNLPVVAAFFCVCTAIIFCLGYFPATTLSLVVKGPAPNVYKLYYDSGSGFAADQGAHSDKLFETFTVSKSDGDSKVSFTLPDKKIKNIRIVCGYKPGQVLIKNIKIEGMLGEHVWTPETIYKEFRPLQNVAGYRRTAEGLSLYSTGEIGPTGGSASIEYVDPAAFERIHSTVSQHKAYLFLLLMAVSVIMVFVVSDVYRVVHFLVFIASSLLYVGLLHMENLSVFLFGILSVLLLIELALNRNKTILVLFGLCLALFVVESAFLIREVVTKQKVKRNVYYSWKPDVVYRLDATLGYRRTGPLRWLESTRLVDESADEYIYKDVAYTTDEKGRRATRPMPGAKKFAVFFGCSYTWGQGLGDDKTMAAQFENLSHGEYQSFNYGVQGWGAGQMHELLKDPSMFDDVSQREGIGVYNFRECAKLS